MSTATATAYKYSVAGHLSFSAPKCEKAQKSSGFWANRTYWLCIKDNVLIDPTCGNVRFHDCCYHFVKVHTDDIIELSTDIAEFEKYEVFTRVSLSMIRITLPLMNAMPTLQKKALKN